MVPFNLGYHHLPRIIIIPFCPFTLEFNVTLSHKDHAINLMNHMTTFCLNMYHDDGHYCLTSKCCKQSWIDRFVAIIYFLLQTYKVCIVYQFVIQLIFFIHTTKCTQYYFYIVWNILTKDFLRDKGVVGNM